MPSVAERAEAVRSFDGDGSVITIEVVSFAAAVAAALAASPGAIIPTCPCPPPLPPRPAFRVSLLCC